MAADAAQLDVDNAAGSQFNRRDGVASVVNAFVQANGGLQLRLAISMSDKYRPKSGCSIISSLNSSNA